MHDFFYYCCSLFGIVGVTDACLEALSKSCSNTLTTLDVNGCIAIKVQIYADLMVKKLSCFAKHLLFYDYLELR